MWRGLLRLRGRFQRKHAELVESCPMPYSRTAPLMAMVQSSEEAEALAKRYGITLIRCGSRVATFFAEDPVEVIRRGREKGWPPLELNYESRGF